MTAMVDVLYPSCQAKELLKNQGREHPLENFSYFCKICSKRFVSGRALGGHMRAHVPPSVPAYTFAETEFQKSKRPRVSDDKSMEEKVDEEGLERNGRNLMYALRRSPKRSWRFVDLDDSFLLGHGLDSSPIDSSLNCDLCGKEFSSWKGLIEHKNCHCEAHQDSGDDHIEESHKHETRDKEEPGSKTDSEIEIDHTSENSRKFDKWMKGKGFKRPRYAIQLNPPEQVVSATNNEEEDMAMCLVMLASGVNTTQAPQFQMGAADPELGDLKLPTKGFQLLESVKKKPKYKKIDGPTDLHDDEAKKGRYKCTTCSKVFLSYQALGGHRTSHNKVKGCFTQIGDENLKSIEEEITDEELNTGLDSQLSGNFHKPPAKERNKNFCVQARDETSTVEAVAFSGKKTLRVHGCSICHRVFASGQALGGHKRCHWGSTGASDTSSSNKETPMQQQMPARVELLDLNLPAPVDDDWEAEPVDDDCDAENLNTVDSDGASYAQTHSPPYLLSLLMGNHQKEGLFLYNTPSHVSKDDDADTKLGKDIGLDSKLGLVKDIGFGRC